jgi:hypothetical protein
VEVVPGTGALHAADSEVTLLTYDLAFDGSVLQLQNQLDGANYGLEVECTARDVDGLEAITSTRLVIQGSERVYEAAYYEDLRACIEGYLDDLERGAPSGPLPHGDPVRLGERIRALLSPPGGERRELASSTLRMLDATVRAAGQELVWLRDAATSVKAPQRRLVARAGEAGDHG